MYLLYSLCSLRGLAILPDLFSDRPPHHPSAQGGKRSWPNPEVDYRPLTEVHTLEGIPGFDFCGLALQLSLSAQDVYHADRLKRQSGLFGR